MKPIRIGDRIRYYRSLLDISREELANQQMSNNLIKYIECGNKNLTLRKAIIIADTLNRIAVEKNIQLFITVKDLIEPENECAHKFCCEELRKLEDKNFDDEKYDSILNIAQQYDLSEIIIKVYEKKASNYFSSGKFLEAISLLKKILEKNEALNISKYTVKSLNTLGSSYCMLNDYSTALEYYKRSYYEFVKNNIGDKTLESKILYNIALCYKKFNNYDETLLYIEKILMMDAYDKSAYINVMILKANIYIEQKKYEEALDMYKIISEFGPNYLYIVHHNMAIAFIRLNKIDESIKYLTKSINEQINYETSYLTISLINMALLYKKEGLFKPSIIFFEHAVTSSIKYKQIMELIESCNNLYEIYSYSNSLQNYQNILYKLIEYRNEGIIDLSYEKEIEELITKYNNMINQIKSDIV
jgi:tetratricopeptide (TPR) repeat protein